MYPLSLSLLRSHTGMYDGLAGKLVFFLGEGGKVP